MPRSRVWSALSPSYQTRLLRNGITQQSYEAGVSLRTARGHKNTPEHPEDAIKNPSRWTVYRSKLKKMQQEVIRRKEEIWSNRHKWDHHRARAVVLRGTAPDFKRPGVNTLKKLLDMSDEEWEVLVAQRGVEGEVGIDDEKGVLFYH